MSLHEIERRIARNLAVCTALRRAKLDYGPLYSELLEEYAALDRAERQAKGQRPS